MFNSKKIKGFFKNTDHKILLLAFCIYIPFIFLGYGSDYDSYNVVWAGKNFVETLDYVPSRVPGFFVYEFITFFLNLIGGSILTNLASLVMSIIILKNFMQFCKDNEVPQYRLLTLIFMLHPYYLVNSTCTMDYLFSFGFAFLGLVKLNDHKFVSAGLLLALGIGSRLTTVLVVGTFLLWIFIVQKDYRGKVILAGFITAITAFLFYIPSLDFAEWNIAYFSPSVGTDIFWTPILRIGRFVYKTIYFWSPVVIIIMVWGIIRLFFYRTLWTDLVNKNLIKASITLIFVIQLFYMYLPTEPAYMIPTIPFWLIILGYSFSHKKNVLILMLILIILSNFLSINIARPNKINQATGAQYGLWIEQGHLVKDINKRIEYIHCGYQPCDIPNTDDNISD